jgi:hypothetical protein
VLKPRSTPSLNWNKWEEVSLPPLPRTGACRYCKHCEWDHRYNEKGQRPCRENFNGLVKFVPCDATTIIVPRKELVGHCPCMEYVPGDNLAFLEWKSKRSF